MSIQKKFGDFTITYPDESISKFRVNGPGIESHEFCESFGQAAEMCEKKERQANSTKKQKLSLSIVTETGVETTITGIHAGHGAILTSPVVKSRYSSYSLLPNVPWIISAIAETKKLSARENAIRAVLQKFHISPTTKYDSYNESKHSMWIEGITKNHETLTAAAIKQGGLGELLVADPDEE